MNVENINKLADALEEVQVVSPALFNMGAWGENMDIPINKRGRPGISRIEDCQTVGCIGGWTRFLFAEFGNIFKWPGKFADEFLGLDENEHKQLLLPGPDTLQHFGRVHYKDITIPMVVKVLRNFAATGFVNWDLVLEEAQENQDDNDDG